MDDFSHYYSSHFAQQSVTMTTVKNEPYRHIVDGHVEYKVEKILAMTPDDIGWPVFLVKWRGYED